MSIDKQVEEIRSISQVIQKMGLGEHLSDAIAVGVFDAGYRKASDVAREIFEDLKLKAPFFCENQIAYEHFCEELAELKKKYIGEDVNVTTKTEGEG